MAYKFMLKQPFEGMNFLWNVSDKVGCKTECPNRATDVELVKFLARETIKGPFHRFSAACRNPPLTMNGSFDAVLGFWIYAYEDYPGATSDGIVSPARGSTYAPGEMWLISYLNARVHKLSPDLSAGLDQNQQISQALRTELQKTTPY